MHLYIRKGLFILSLSFLSLSIPINATVEAKKNTHLTPAQVQRDIQIAQEAYSRIHPGYTRYAKQDELSAAWNGVIGKAQAKDGLSLPEFYLEIQRVLTLIACDHTKAELPKSLSQERDITPVYLPVLWQIIENRGFISEDYSSYGVQRGDEILAIDNRTLSELLDTVRPLIPVDGYTSWAKDGEITASFEFKGGAIDNFGALMWEVKPEALLSIRKADGSTSDVKLARITYKEWRKLATKNTATDFDKAIRFERIGINAAYLAVDSFVNYRTNADPEKLFDPIFKSLKEEKRSQLILDLRKNGGGSSDARLSLMAHLINNPIKPKKEIRTKTLDLDGLRDYLWTWEKRALKPNRLTFKKNSDNTYSLRSWFHEDLKTLKPDKYAFDGELIILTSNDNSSGSTSFTATLKSLGRATVIGEKTGGSAEGPTAGIIFFLTLPESKVRTRLPALIQYNNVKSFEKGMGVSPDIEAPMTINDFIKNNDPALEAAKKLILSNH